MRTLFLLEWVGIHETFSNHIWLWLLLLNHIIRLHLTEFICLFQWYPITNIQVQISIKPICDWPVYLTASADEWLACNKQISFHSTTSFMDPLLAAVAQNRIIADFCYQLNE